MPGTWRSDHILNLVLVARADGELRPIEVLWLSSARAALDGSQRTLADAIIRSYGGQPIATGSLISDERCLRDMVLMAVIDGHTDEAEMRMVEAFIDCAKIPAERVSAIVREALQRAGRERELVINSIEAKYLTP